ncbi:hypothetical protein LCGC14_2456300 [marine sediment metagenome]|uniref:Uncharacterized protein n=1 Tax=marine sediment metagenome TaxID=412755 RepID=A0A0F9C286_9ZZZZ
METKLTHVKILLRDKHNITLSTPKSFENFVKDLFQEKIYMSIVSDESSNLAINTGQIISVEEIKK